MKSTDKELCKDIDENAMVRKKCTQEQYNDTSIQIIEKDGKVRRLVPDHLDGGWGWMVVLGSFISHLILGGIHYSFGVYIVQFIDYFRVGRGVTGWIGSLLSSVCFLSGNLHILIFHTFIYLFI